MRTINKAELLRLQLSIIFLLLILVVVNAIAWHPHWFGQTTANKAQESTQVDDRALSHGRRILESE
jgi:sensor histidine kinase regulating citrate/malate metabolism